MQKFILKITIVGSLIFLLAACSKKSTASNDNQNASRNQQTRQARGAKGAKGERAQFSDLLSQMDKNKDGKLAEAEVKGRLKKNFSEIDKDKDGFISEAEFKNAPTPPRRGRN